MKQAAWKKVNTWLRLFFFAQIGVYLGKWLFLIWDYRARPGLYTLSSFPWYTSMLSYTAIALPLLLLTGGAWWFASRKAKGPRD